ncbi:MAG: ferrochelatase [Colwellia sp.]|nr:ferrochelatase [Colwellia sp.]
MKSRFSAKNNNIDSKSIKTAVLLTNLGTPEQPTVSALRSYLREFLSDPRVVEIPRLLWMIILHGVILRIRPKKSAKLYQSIWTKEGSPLLIISQMQKEKVAAKLAQQQYSDNVIVDVAMRYGQPSISHVLKKFQQQGIENLIVLPLYPQYAGPTTASTFDAVSKELQTWRYVPSLNFINGYHNNAHYITALANTITEHINAHGKPDKLVLSYHGMPELFCQWGDPYYELCQLTTELLTAELLTRSLMLSTDDFVMTFQSRFGKAKWLQPYTDKTLKNLAKQGNKHIAIISPAFSADCLETLEELEHENRAIFIDAGGEQYHYIAALNERDDHIEALMSILDPILDPILEPIMDIKL